MKNKKRSANIAFLSLIFTLIIILTLLPSFTAVSLALALLPICVTAQIKGWKLGVLAGGFYGFLSFITAWTISPSPLRFVFQNPLVSIFPRLVVGIVAYFTYIGLKKLFYKKTETEIAPRFKAADVLATYFSALAAVITNTVLVLSLMLVFYNGNSFGETTVNIKYVLGSILTINTLLEVIIIPLLTAPIVFALKKAKLDR